MLYQVPACLISVVRELYSDAMFRERSDPLLLHFG